MHDNQWIKEIGSNDEYWAVLDDRIYPSCIVRQYAKLRDFTVRGYVYGLMLQLKDLYETLIKYPCIFALGTIDMNDNDKTALGRIFSALLDNPLSMGGWDSLASLLRKSGLVVDEDLLELLKMTRSLCNRKVRENGSSNIINWRNDTIGHGFLRSEDDEENNEECVILISFLKDFFSDEKVARAYAGMYFSVDGIRISGPVDEDLEYTELEFNLGGVNHGKSKFACAEYLNCFFFDSYYSNKHLTKYISYDDGRRLGNNNDLQSYFNELYSDYKKSSIKMGDSVAGKIGNKFRDEVMKCLSDDEDYIIPKYLVNNIKTKMTEMGSGIIMLEMERGMGKTAFTLHADSEFRGKKLFDNAFVKTYNLSDAVIRGVSDFYVRTNDALKHGPDGNYSKEETAISSDKSSDVNSDAFAALMNSFTDMCSGVFTGEGEEIEYGIYILDGADELNASTDNILSIVPPSDKLKAGTFIVITSRCPDEEFLSRVARQNIERCEKMADAVISVKRNDPDYLDGLTRFARKIVPGMTDDEYSSILQKSDFRFLNCKLLRLVDKDMVSGTEDAIRVMARNYLDRILSVRNERSGNVLLRFLSAITLLGSISLDEFTEYLELSEITYEMIGCINDALPLLTVERRKNGNNYRFGSDEYRQLFIEGFMDDLKIFIGDLWEELERWYSVGQAELEKVCKETDSVSIRTDELAIFGNYDVGFYYLNLMVSIYSLSEKTEQKELFLSNEHFLIYCRYVQQFFTVLRFYNSLFCYELRDNVSDVYCLSLKYFMDDCPDLLFENAHIFRNMDSLVLCRNEYLEILDLYISRYRESHDERWLGLFFDFSVVSEANGYADRIFSGVGEDACVDYCIKEMLPVFSSMEYYSKLEWRTDEYTDIIDNLLDRGLTHENTAKLLSIKLFITLMDGLACWNGWFSKYFDDAQSEYEKMKKEGYELVFFDGIKCGELSRENVYNLLSPIYRTAAQKEYLIESVDALKKMNEEDPDALKRRFSKLRDEYERCDRLVDRDDIRSAFKVYYLYLRSRIMNSDMPLSDSLSYSALTYLINLLFTGRSGINEMRQILYSLMERNDWCADPIYVSNICDLIAGLTSDEECDTETLRSYLDLYFHRVDMPSFLHNSLVSTMEAEIPEELLKIQKPLCTNFGISYVDNYLKLYEGLGATVGDVERIASEMSDGFNDLYKAFINCDLKDKDGDIYPLLCKRAKLNAVCRKVIGHDVDLSWMSFLEELERDYIREITEFDEYSRNDEIEAELSNICKCYYMAAEYRKALTLLHDLMKVLSDESGYPEGVASKLNDLKNDVDFLCGIFSYLSGETDKDKVLELNPGENMEYYRVGGIIELGLKIIDSIRNGEDRKFDYLPDTDFDLSDLQIVEIYDPSDPFL